MDSLSFGKDVFLKKCDVLNRKLWTYDTNTIRAGASGLCMTYATSLLSISPNDIVELTPCASAATWTFYDVNIYGHEISEKNYYDKVHIVSMQKDAATGVEKCLSVLSPSLNSHVIYTDCQLNDQKQVRVVRTVVQDCRTREYELLHSFSSCGLLEYMYYHCSIRPFYILLNRTGQPMNWASFFSRTIPSTVCKLCPMPMGLK